jgi:hypothetical protein
MTGPDAGAFFIGYNSDASGRQFATDWFCIPPGPDVPNIIILEERNEDHTVRRSCGWTTKLRRD